MKMKSICCAATASLLFFVGSGMLSSSGGGIDAEEIDSSVLTADETIEPTGYYITYYGQHTHDTASFDVTVSEQELLLGDCNLDGKFSVADVVMLQKWLLCAGDLTCWQNEDFCADNHIDAFDLCNMKRELLEQNAAQMVQLTADTEWVTTAESAPVVTFRLDANNYSLPTPNDALPVAALYNADTDEMIGVMSEEGSNIYTYTLKIDNSEMGTQNFYASINGKDGSQGDTVKSDIVSVEIIHVFLESTMETASSALTLHDVIT